MATTPEDAVRHLVAQPVRYQATQRVAYLPMDSDGDPLGHALADQCQQPAPAEASTEVGAEPGHPRMPRRRPLLTPAGWFFAPYLIGIAAVAAWAYSAWQ